MTFFAGQILSADDLNAVVPGTTPTQIVYRANDTLAAATVTGAKALRVRCLGGSAAGCGAAATGVGEASSGGGGGSGGYSESILDMASITFPVTITVGAGGTGVAGAAGNAGGDTSFGTYVIAKGAVATSGPMATGATNAWATGGDGGSTTGAVGQIQSRGSDGQPGIRAGTVARGGSGAQSPLGGSQRAANTTSSAGLAGNPYGGAGSGANNGASAATKAGGNGDPGVCIVEPIYN